MCIRSCVSPGHWSAAKNPRSLSASRRPLGLKPLQTSRPAGRTRSNASRALPGLSPPASRTGTLTLSTMRRLVPQSCTRPVPPSSLTASRGLPESSSSVSTRGAAARASSTASGPATWITCTSRVVGSRRRRRRSSASATASTSCTAVVPQRRCCSAMASASVRHVSRKVSVGYGTAAAMAVIVSSGIGPGPLGIAETRPIADAPAPIASRASSRSAMQQTLTKGTRTSVPAIGVLVEVLVLGPHDAEALAGRRLHDDPGLDLPEALRAELLEPADLGFDVVGLDIEVHAAVVVDRLHFDVHALVRDLQLDVAVAFLARQGLGRHAERLGPEARRAVQVVGAAVDDEARESALVHDLSDLRD